MCARSKYFKHLPRSPEATAGFTLIEALVVLIFVGIVTAVLTDSLTRVFELRTRFAAYLDSAAASQMTLSWLRRSTESLIPDYPEGEGRFHGTAVEFSGISLAAPGADPGIPHGISWRLLNNVQNHELRLETRVDRRPWVAVAAWPELSGRFDYDGGDGRWVPEWPPALVTQNSPQIPRLIRVVIGSSADGWSAILAPFGPRMARVRNDNLLRSILPQ